MEHSLKYIIYCIQHSSVCVLSYVQLFVTSWTVAHQAPLSMEFSRQDYWNGLPFPSPRDLPDPGIFLTQGWHLCLLHWQADSLPLSHQGSPKEYSVPYVKKEHDPKAKKQAKALSFKLHSTFPREVQEGFHKSW